MINIKQIEENLKKELQTLNEEMKGLGNADKTDVLESDYGDVADKFESEGEELSVADELSARKTAVEKALSRIADGRFGKCKVCGKEIEEKRIEANPAAETCIEHVNE